MKFFALIVLSSLFVSCSSPGPVLSPEALASRARIDAEAAYDLQQRTDIYGLHQAGWTDAQIAARMNLPVTAVRGRSPPQVTQSQWRNQYILTNPVVARPSDTEVEVRTQRQLAELNARLEENEQETNNLRRAQQEPFYATPTPAPPQPVFDPWHPQ